jgi:hypothetical protein
MLAVFYCGHGATERASFQFGFAHKQNTRPYVSSYLFCPDGAPIPFIGIINRPSA